jgi:hypothetical protein
MSVCCQYCVLLGRGLCDGPITYPEGSYRVWCVWMWSRNLNSGKAVEPLRKKEKQLYNNRKIWREIIKWTWTLPVSDPSTASSITIYADKSYWDRNARVCVQSCLYLNTACQSWYWVSPLSAYACSPDTWNSKSFLTFLTQYFYFTSNARVPLLFCTRGGPEFKHWRRNGIH